MPNKGLLPPSPTILRLRQGVGSANDDDVFRRLLSLRHGSVRKILLHNKHTSRQALQTYVGR